MSWHAPRLCYTAHGPNSHPSRCHFSQARLDSSWRLAPSRLISRSLIPSDRRRQAETATRSSKPSLPNGQGPERRPAQSVMALFSSHACLLFVPLLLWLPLGFVVSRLQSAQTAPSCRLKQLMLSSLRGYETPTRIHKGRAFCAPLAPAAHADDKYMT